MRITTFNPLIFTKDAPPLIELSEALAILQEHGFIYYQDTGDVETASSTVAIMKSPSGFSIDVSKHRKDGNHI